MKRWRRLSPGKLREGVPDISRTTEYAILVALYKNCYAEIGTTWASSIVTFPTLAAHIMGQLMGAEPSNTRYGWIHKKS